MRAALITTTINVPTVLSLYRKLDPEVKFFVALDKKTPITAVDFCNSLPNCEAVWGEEYTCSSLISWGTISRRNIALLEALKWGAEIIITLDDDNIPIDPFYFQSFRRAFNWRNAEGHGFPAFNGIMVDKTEWFDVGTLLDPVSPHRGFPHDRAAPPNFSHTTSCRVGVAAGICLGDPDIDACTRISRHPVVHRCSELLRSGIVVDPRRTRTVFNSQNTAFIRELAPCFLMVPSYGRYDDIFASLVAQRVMRERGLHVHLGQPFVWQQRNPHNLLTDLRAEQWGAEHILEFSAWLDGFLGVHDVIGFLRVMATNLPKFIPSGTQELWLAWLDDCERVMK
jgi:hypothetical protein